MQCDGLQDGNGCGVDGIRICRRQKRIPLAGENIIGKLLVVRQLRHDVAQLNRMGGFDDYPEVLLVPFAG